MALRTLFNATTTSLSRYAFMRVSLPSRAVHTIPLVWKALSSSQRRWYSSVSAHAIDDLLAEVKRRDPNQVKFLAAVNSLRPRLESNPSTKTDIRMRGLLEPAREVCHLLVFVRVYVCVCVYACVCVTIFLCPEFLAGLFG